MFDRRILFSTLVALFLSEIAVASIHGHSGLVLHVDKYGHLSGHSTHYDYRVYPEKSLIEPLPYFHQYNIIGNHHHFEDEDMKEAFHLIDDEEDEYHGSHPFFYYIHHNDHQSYHHEYHH